MLMMMVPGATADEPSERAAATEPSFGTRAEANVYTSRKGQRSSSQEI